ncbi:MAG: twin-arginine translocase TatA/TatE family subunit [Candidatus Sericytochromatia bacterium]|nr:twin-arginine translocase TatA/TatE family subunit [Candidatus Sericytochromatia bacterium]
MFGIGAPELVLILIIALVIFGPGKLPEIGKSVGKAMNEFKKASRDLTSDSTEEKIEHK